MNIRKFIAPTTRQALKDIRDALGDEAIILSNRSIEGGVEILATVNADMAEIEQARGETAPTVVAAKPVSAPPVEATPRVEMAASLKPTPAPTRPTRIEANTVNPVAVDSQMLQEIKLMHSQLQQQLATLSWSNLQQQAPQRSHLLRNMLNNGFSAALSRQLIDKLPADKGEAWLKQVLKRNLRTADEPDSIVNQGGVYALIGPTGVGKTTTTAKLAARAVVRFGANKVALITTDSYRIGAYEQLKIYGKILGVTVHAVRDADDLRLTLSTLRDKHLVLIDTIGMGQRDERVADQRAMFAAAGVSCLLLLNTTSGGETLEDVTRVYRKATETETSPVIGCILTKLDETVNPAAALDVVIRHRLPIHYMTNGQRVPEDLHLSNPDYLLHQAFKLHEEKTAFTLQNLDLTDLMSAEDQLAGHTPEGVLKAGLHKEEVVDYVQ